MRYLAAVFAAGMLALADARAQTILVREGETIPGVGRVDHVQRPIVNDQGSWIVTAHTDHANPERAWVYLEDGRALGEFREIDPMRFWRDLTGATLVALCYPDQAVLNGSAAPGELEAIVAGLEDLALRLVRP